ncbi:peptidase s41 family protein [Coniochaeta ligniaria NRRL 30616]|uniref:Peptidase s41 family protein n=1 Tax=Coniochaeta ligniaria NRRL 30616 TaxID=1408157 RepID=A0A1J7IZG9_9PEZI|nr:peptidase s41 family protein [Coniochaeta ligniaria NRRL 30616]
MRPGTLAVSALLAVAAELVTADCAADNCVRAFRATQTPGRLSSAQAFCATFTATSVATTAIPTYAANNCKENQNGDLYFRVSSACSCIAPATTSVPPASTTAAACALVSSSWSVQKAAATGNTIATPTVAAALAYECLNSVPLKKDEAIALVDALEPYLEWQSDPGYKADPPAGYYYPGYDLFAALAKVRSNLVADKYPNEYQFQADLYNTVFGPGHDGHYVFYPDALTKVFEWRRQRSLVSISEDGTSLPVIKLYEDVISAPETASIVKLINGIDAATYVLNTINAAGYNQDVDSQYNSMFFEKASVAVSGGKGYFSAGGRIRYIYQGENTTFTFENGTVLTLENKAAVKADMSGVVDGAAYYTKFCTPASTASSAATAEIAAAGEGGSIPGYPDPLIATDDGIVAGYYLSGPGLDDVAVIVVLAFENELPSEFQAVAADFYDMAVAAGKTKLVIDFQGNGGGYILQGYDFFRQLFPKVDPFGASRWKENDAFKAIAHIFSDAVADLDPYTSADEDLISAYESWFNYRYDLNLTGQQFETFEDKFSPHVYKATPYTNLMRWNLTDPLTTVNDTFGMGMEITGYGTLSNATQPFAAEDIVMLYDGVCASTCTLASEFLRLQGGVKSVAFGGRPQPGPIQGVGGVKGAQTLSYGNINYYVEYAASLGNSTPEQRAALARYSELPVQRSTASAVNSRDAILPGNVNDGTPAQYVAEEADCRLYWTEAMVKDVTEVWKAAANAAFNGAECAYGGIERSKRSVVGGEKRERVAPVVRRSAVVDRSVKVPLDSEAWLAVHRQKAVP